MEQQYEIVRYPKIKHIRIFLDEVKYRTQHLHGDYELCFSLQGEAIFYSLNDSISLKEGEILFLDSNQAHSIVSEKDPFIGLFIQVSNNFLSDYLPEMHSKGYRSANLKEYLSLEEINGIYNDALNIALEYFKESENYRQNTLKFVLGALDYIFLKVPSEPLTSKEVDNRRKNAERLKRIINYIDSHLSDKISQSEIAKNEAVTTTHLSHLFKEGLGINFQDYLNERRLEIAIQLMRSSSKGMIDISYESGFSDPKYMSRLFQKRFGCSPKEFKNKNIIYPITLGHRDEAILERIYSEEEAIKYLLK